MKRPDINDYGTLVTYSELQDRYIDYLESQKLIATEQLREETNGILHSMCIDFVESKDFESGYYIDKVLSLIQPKADIVFPTDEDIQKEIDLYEMQTWDWEMAYLHCANWMKEKIKELNNIK